MASPQITDRQPFHLSGIIKIILYFDDSKAIKADLIEPTKFKPVIQYFEF